MPGGVERGIGPVERDVVGQGHVAGAEGIVRPERAQRVLDGVAALHPQQRGEPAAFAVALDVVRRERQREAVGVPRDHPPGDVELLELHPRVAAVLHLAVDVDRPELGADLALGQTLEVGMLGRARAEVVRGHVARMSRGAADLPRQVVVAVDQRRGAEQRASVRERGVRRGRLRGGGSGHGDESGEEEKGRDSRRATGSRARRHALAARPSWTSSGRVMNSGQIVRSYSYGPPVSASVQGKPRHTAG